MSKKGEKITQSGNLGMVKHDLIRTLYGSKLYKLRRLSLGLPDLVNDNIGYPAKFEFQVNKKSFSMFLSICISQMGLSE